MGRSKCGVGPQKYTTFSIITRRIRYNSFCFSTIATFRSCKTRILGCNFYNSTRRSTQGRTNSMDRRIMIRLTCPEISVFIVFVQTQSIYCLVCLEIRPQNTDLCPIFGDRRLNKLARLYTFIM